MKPRDMHRIFQCGGLVSKGVVHVYKLLRKPFYKFTEIAGSVLGGLIMTTGPLTTRPEICLGDLTDIYVHEPYPISVMLSKTASLSLFLLSLRTSRAQVTPVTRGVFMPLYEQEEMQLVAASVIECVPPMTRYSLQCLPGISATNCLIGTGMEAYSLAFKGFGSLH